MSRPRKTFSREFKAKVALCAIREDATIAELSTRFSVHPTQINKWKKSALASLPDAFGPKQVNPKEDHERQVKQLQRKVGQLTMEKDFLVEASKRLGLGGGEKW